jgi:hypothetical protein
MRRLSFLLCAFVLAAGSTSAQQSRRDPQGLLALQRSVQAMGAQLPADVSATGTVVLTEGANPQTGTIRILAKGTNPGPRSATLR